MPTNNTTLLLSVQNIKDIKGTIDKGNIFTYRFVRKK